jgi:hypothetical protein
MTVRSAIPRLRRTSAKRQGLSDVLIVSLIDRRARRIRGQAHRRAPHVTRDLCIIAPPAPVRRHEPLANTGGEFAAASETTKGRLVNPP